MQKQAKFPTAVLMISHTASLGGAEKALLEFADFLIKKHKSCFIIVPKNGPLIKEIRKRKIKYQIIPFGWWTVKKLSSKEKCRQNKINDRAVLKIQSCISRFKPDWVFTNTIVIPWGAIAARRMQKPHAWFIHEFGDKDHRFKFRYPYKDIIKIINSLSNIIFVNSEALKKHILSFTSKDKTIRVYYKIIIDPRKLKTSDKLFHRENSLKIVLVGRIVETKGQIDAVLATRELINKKLDLELLLIGKCKTKNAKYLEKIKTIIKADRLNSRIKICGYKSNPYPIMKAADICLMCSKNEAFGRVTLEAMLLKKPVIGTKLGGTVELIKDNYNGFLYKPGNYKKLASQIRYFYKRKDKILQFGKNGLCFAQKLIKGEGPQKIYHYLFKTSLYFVNRKGK